MEITSLEELTNFWFQHPEYHFNSNQKNDYIIKQKCESLFNKYNDINYSLTDILKWNNQQIIGLIILYDQITRHIYRNNDIIIKQKLLQIIPIVKKFYSIKYKELTHQQFCFTLLPLRHLQDYKHFIYVINQTWKKLENYTLQNKNIQMENEKKQYIKFLKASYQQYNKQTDDIDRIQYYQANTNNNNLSQELLDILDSSCNINIFYNYDIHNNQNFNFCDFSYLDKSNIYFISLSGGVDSMVISYIMKKNGFNIVAVHISYQNKNNNLSNKEIQFIKRWCDILKINLYIRSIYEIKRKKCMTYGLRDIYESYTKNIRFKTYKNSYILEKQKKYLSLNQQNIINKLDDLPNVILGHNKDDTFENILTNIASQSHYDNLTGMQLISIIDDIKFIRPMINISKSEIYNFAKNHNIPYLQNSTPSWSQRGQIRDIIKPCLLKWNSNIENALFKLTQSISSMNIIYNQYIDNLIFKIKNNNNKYQIHIQLINIDIYFWNNIFNKIDVIISQKSLYNWIDKLNFIKNNFNKLQTNTIYKHNINKNFQIKWTKIDDVNLIINF